MSVLNIISSHSISQTHDMLIFHQHVWLYVMFLSTLYSHRLTPQLLVILLSSQLHLDWRYLQSNFIVSLVHDHK